jgi:DNA-binding XRE family transcriptional regulator
MAATKYKPEFSIEVIRMGQEGRSKAAMAACFGVSEKTMDNWTKNPDNFEFKDALEIAMAASEAYWEDIGIKGAKGILPKFNASAWIFCMKNRFRNNYKDTMDSNIDVTGSMKGMTDAELDATIKALVARKETSKAGGSEGSLPEISA